MLSLFAGVVLRLIGAVQRIRLKNGGRPVAARRMLPTNFDVATPIYIARSEAEVLQPPTHLVNSPALGQATEIHHGAIVLLCNTLLRDLKSRPLAVAYQVAGWFHCWGLLVMRCQRQNRRVEGSTSHAIHSARGGEDLFHGRRRLEERLLCKSVELRDLGVLDEVAEGPLCFAEDLVDNPLCLACFYCAFGGNNGYFVGHGAPNPFHLY
mmetsp:Transcript_43856/g.60932  ORF Transcript_43856/g.60932 Transcript_43856/m.60932 type:complete len:209 (+) Transcript_43856:237-863(+)